MMRAFLQILIMMMMSSPAAAVDITGRVDRVADGDTLTIAGTRIRICGIQAPERGDAGYRASGRALAALTAGRTVTCRQVGGGTPCDGRSKRTSWDRIVAQCFVGGRDLAAEQVRAGHAEDWRTYSGGYYDR